MAWFCCSVSILANNVSMICRTVASSASGGRFANALALKDERINALESNVSLRCEVFGMGSPMTDSRRLRVLRTFNNFQAVSQRYLTRIVPTPRQNRLD